jgi:hypothetical protein
MRAWSQALCSTHIDPTFGTSSRGNARSAQHVSAATQGPTDLSGHQQALSFAQHASLPTTLSTRFGVEGE